MAVQIYDPTKELKIYDPTKEEEDKDARPDPRAVMFSAPSSGFVYPTEGVDAGGKTGTE